jgi:predicted alpha/beta superfamily hydrolase
VTGWRPYAEVHGPDNTISGTVLVWPRLEGRGEIPAREILVYLPPSLATEWAGSTRIGRRFPVLYFHDGQNVFDAVTSNSGEWEADETLELLAGEGIEAIAVAIPNAGEARMDEYNPWRGRPPVSVGGPLGRRLMGGRGDAYLAWLVGTVKPLIDSSFPTRAEREATGIIGSSMGGLISLYALLAHPDTFGLAGVMSPSLVWKDYRVLQLIEERGLPPSRIHLDMGGREWRGMMADARRLRDLLVSRGFVEDRDLHYVEERYAPHHESAWARRLPDALRFLLAQS